MEKLKPCPFCGSVAAIKSTTTRTYPNHGKAWCYCTKCFSSGEAFADYDDDGSFVFKAIEAWNRRADDA